MSFHRFSGRLQKIGVLWLALVALSIGMLAGTNSARAASYINYYCDCTPNSDGVCRCFKMGSYTIEPSGTSKEFRGHCSNATVQKRRVDITGKKNGTSCAKTDTIFGYASASCTNWNPIESDGINISVRCAIDNPSLVNGDLNAP